MHLSPSLLPPKWHDVALRLLPAVRQHARIAFRHLGPEAREGAVQEVICNACCAVARLAGTRQARSGLRRPLGPLRGRQVRDGRKVGCKLNIHDVLSPYCQERKSVTVERLDHFDDEENAWSEVIVEHRRAGPT